MLPKKNRFQRFFHKAYHRLQALAFIRKGKSVKAEDYFRCYGASDKDMQIILNIFEHNGKKGINDHYRGFFLEKVLEYNAHGLTKSDFHRFLKVDVTVAKALFDRIYDRPNGEILDASDFEKSLECKRYGLALRMLKRYLGDIAEISAVLKGVPQADKADIDFQQFQAEVALQLADQIEEKRKYGGI